LICAHDEPDGANIRSLIDRVSEFWSRSECKQFILESDKKKIRVDPREFAVGVLRNYEWA
jgi:hypothetical protein